MVIGTMNVILCSEEMLLVCKAEMKIRNCYLLVASGTTGIENNKTKPLLSSNFELKPI